MYSAVAEEEMEPQFIIYRCTRKDCGLRFPVVIAGQSKPDLKLCPACRGALEVASDAFPRLPVESSPERVPGPQLEVLLDNIRSAWNVGSMLRTCDGAGVRKVHLCGVTSLPGNPKVAKTSLGAEKNMPWAFYPDGVRAASQLKDQGLRLWALEGGPRSSSLFEASYDRDGPPIALVAGNELSGVDPGILDLCEQVVCLPMLGVKGSLNVAVAFGIAVYFIRFGRKYE